MTRYILLAFAWMCFAIGCVGIFVPVLPTTPLLLLATFLFAKSSPRLHAWMQSTKVYRNYVVPFKDAGGIPRATKFRILAISYLAIGISAFFVQKWYLYIVLGCAMLFLAYLVGFRIPTVSKNEVTEMRDKRAETRSELSQTCAICPEDKVSCCAKPAERLVDQEID